jgi:hypothetical protein
VRDRVLRRNDRRRLWDVLAEDLGPDEPGQPDCELVADEFLGRHLEDLCCQIVSMWTWRGCGIEKERTVDFLEGQLLRLANEAEDHEPGYQVQTSVESESADLRHGVDHGREGQTEDTSCENNVSDSQPTALSFLHSPKVLLMQTAQAMPCSRWMVGKTSAEYWKATGPSPSEYMIVNR